MSINTSYDSTPINVGSKYIEAEGNISMHFVVICVGGI